MDNKINVLHALHGSLDERANDKGAISDTSANPLGSILYLNAWTSEDAKSVFCVVRYG